MTRSSDPSFVQRINKLRNIKCREIMEGCNECDKIGPCFKHSLLINQIVLHPKLFSKSLELPGDQIHPDEMINTPF